MFHREQLPKWLQGCIFHGYMTGAFLRELREKRGLKAAWVAERAGYAQPHYSKIEAKESISVEEYVRIMEAMDLPPGDYLRNSMEEIKPVLPLVEELQKFAPSAHQRVKRVLQELAAMLEEKLAIAPVLFAAAANVGAEDLTRAQSKSSVLTHSSVQAENAPHAKTDKLAYVVAYSGEGESAPSNVESLPGAVATTRVPKKARRVR